MGVAHDRRNLRSRGIDCQPSHGCLREMPALTGQNSLKWEKTGLHSARSFSMMMFAGAAGPSLSVVPARKRVCGRHFSGEKFSGNQSGQFPIKEVSRRCAI